jgi:hypothetical protein
MPYSKLESRLADAYILDVALRAGCSFVFVDLDKGKVKK